MRALTFVICGLFASVVYASSYVAGDTLGDIELEDQFNHSYALKADTRLLLFSRSMDGGTIIQQVLEANPALTQDEQLIYVADISAMPSLIARFVAIPKFKAFSFRVMLDREGQVTKLLPAAKAHATLILLDRKKIVKVGYFASSDALARALK